MKFIMTNKSGKIIAAILWTYCIFTMARSLGMLFLAYTDEYFHNFDYDMDFFMEKNYIYVRAYDFFPYIIGILLPFVIKWFLPLKLNWWILLGSVILSFCVFMFFDAGFIRNVFYIFENPRINLIFHFSIFLTLFITFTTFLKGSGKVFVQ